MVRPSASQEPDPRSRAGLLSLQEAADRLGVHYMTAYRYVRTGRLRAVQDRLTSGDRPPATSPEAGDRDRRWPVAAR